ncbi:MAG: hypothetical protein LBS69_02485 [Prevotellaceae bacterium]|jgi:hypothetical protein|nr:hypothetical protein [Prevotellaceae bacterium]
MDKIMVMCGIRLSSCISNIDSKSTIQVIDALINNKPIEFKRSLEDIVFEEEK